MKTSSFQAFSQIWWLKEQIYDNRLDLVWANFEKTTQNQSLTLEAMIWSINSHSVI